MMSTRHERSGWLIALCAVGVWAGCSGEVPPISLVEDEDAGALPDARTESPTPDAASPVECAEGCSVGGVCYREGAPSPANPCEVCDPARSRSAFSDADGARCDDGAFCTTGDVCSGGVCVGGAAMACDDGVACTGGDRCDELLRACVPGPSSCAGGESCDVSTGECTSRCAGCAVGGVCYADGDTNPANPCEICDVVRDASGWSAHDGARCDDGAFCTIADTCEARACRGVARECDDGIACTGTETCSEDEDRCIPGATACPDGSLCATETDTCEETCDGCAIGGGCFAPGATNPMNPCETCDPARARSSWSANDGARCDDGAFCTDNDVCVAGACRGAARSCDDGIVCDGEERCDEAADACVRGVTTCATGEVCSPSTDTCELGCDGCVVGGVCFAAGTENPLEGCEICDPARTRSGWSANDGASCEDGSFCTVGDTCLARVCAAGGARSCDDGVTCNGAETCDEGADTCAPGASTCAPDFSCDEGTDSCVGCAGCLIDGACYADGEASPWSSCQTCDVASRRDGWSPRADGTVCNDGSLCTTGDACAAGACVGAPLACDDGIACNGAEVCSVFSGGCGPGFPVCGAHGMCDPVADRCVSTCAGCVIEDICYGVGAANPLSPCEICGAAGDTAWSPDFGASCDDGLSCTTSDSCGVAGCAGTAIDCSDGISCNGVERCQEGTGACVGGFPACPFGESCDLATDSCQASCGGCTIGGICWADGATNPANACERCDAATTPLAWSPAIVCDDGVSCNGVETCSPSTGACVAGSSSCETGFSCDVATDSCICGGCLIDGACHPLGPHPGSACLTCAHVGDTAWSAVPDGAACDDDLACTTNECVAGVCVGTSACLPTEFCNPFSGACSPL